MDKTSDRYLEVLKEHYSVNENYKFEIKSHKQDAMKLLDSMHNRAAKF